MSVCTCERGGPTLSHGGSSRGGSRGRLGHGRVTHTGMAHSIGGIAGREVGGRRVVATATNRWRLEWGGREGGDEGREG